MMGGVMVENDFSQDEITPVKTIQPSNSHSDFSKPVPQKFSALSKHIVKPKVSTGRSTLDNPQIISQSNHKPNYSTQKSVGSLHKPAFSLSATQTMTSRSRKSLSGCKVPISGPVTN